MSLWNVLTTTIALGRSRSSSPVPLPLHGYRPRNGGVVKNSPKPPPPSIVHLQVCLSPACTADGAQATLEKMQALAPANVIVEAGACVSLCGSGPVVQQEAVISKVESSKQQPQQQQGPLKHKRIDNTDKIFKLLYPSPEDVPTDLIRGYELVEQGDVEFSKEQFAKAVELYESAVNVAFRSAVELENQRDAIFEYRKQLERKQGPNQGRSSSPSFNASTTRVPVGLEWLIRARRNEASCKLKLNDINGAMLAAQASCNLSRNTSAESFLVLAEVYRNEEENEGLVGECQALEKVLSLWKDESKLTFAQKNKRRLANIRLQKVQKDIQFFKPKVASDDVMSLQETPVELQSKENSNEN